MADSGLRLGLCFTVRPERQCWISGRPETFHFYPMDSRLRVHSSFFLKNIMLFTYRWQDHRASCCQTLHINNGGQKKNGMQPAVSSCFTGHSVSEDAGSCSTGTQPEKGMCALPAAIDLFSQTLLFSTSSYVWVGNLFRSEERSSEQALTCRTVRASDWPCSDCSHTQSNVFFLIFPSPQ